jgi:hypothetical protein
MGESGWQKGSDCADMKIIRVFPRKTKATPIDENVRINTMPGFFDEADEVHISVCFTWDLQRAEYLAKQWRVVAPVCIGGPATGECGGDFVPGMYLKKGYVITSRGCPNKCWFCSAWKREGQVIRELPITEGNNLLDDNLLACSDDHIMNVFSMLSWQNKPVEFTGGLEAARLTWKWAQFLRDLRIKQMFFAYDTPDDLKPLQKAGEMLIDAGFTTQRHTLRCYVLCGYKGDTVEAATKRMIETIDAGFAPMAMLWRRDDGYRNPDFIGSNFQREWARPSIIYGKIKSLKRKGSDYVDEKTQNQNPMSVPVMRQGLDG